MINFQAAICEKRINTFSKKLFHTREWISSIFTIENHFFIFEGTQIFQLLSKFGHTLCTWYAENNNFVADNKIFNNLLLSKVSISHSVQDFRTSIKTKGNKGQKTCKIENGSTTKPCDFLEHTKWRNYSTRSAR